MTANSLYQIKTHKLFALGLSLFGTSLMVGCTGSNYGLSTSSTSGTAAQSANRPSAPSPLPNPAPSSPQVATPLPATGFSQCATEWGTTAQETCSFNGGSSLVYFGANNSFYSVVVSSPFNCNSATAVMGDPSVGNAKACWVATSALSTPAPTDGGQTGAAVNASFLPMDITLPNTQLPNPDRGASDYAGMDFVGSFDLNSVKSEMASTGRRLFYCLVDLSQFLVPSCNSSSSCSTITSTFISKLEANFATMASVGAKCEMMIGADVNGQNGTDGNPTQIQAFAAQLAPSLHKYSDIIPFAKAGFVGSWGQWFGSLYGNTCGYQSPGAYADCNSYCSSGNGTATSCPYGIVVQNKINNRNAILAAYGSNTIVGFQYPTDLNTWYPAPITVSQAFSTGAYANQARSGMHQDCPLAQSADESSQVFDYGTYASYPGGTPAGAAYVKEMTHYVPFFGEFSGSCTPNITDCATGMNYLARFHGTAFKMIGADFSNYKNGWTAGGCFNQIQNQLGYRFRLDSVSHPGSVTLSSASTAGVMMTIQVKMSNEGWSRLFAPRLLVAQLCNGSTCLASETNSFPGIVNQPNVTDLRILPGIDTPAAPGTNPSNISLNGVSNVAAGAVSNEIDVPIFIPGGTPSGTYSLRLSIPDIGPNTSGNTAFNIQFANTASGNQKYVNGYMTTGTSVLISTN